MSILSVATGEGTHNSRKGSNVTPQKQLLFCEVGSSVNGVVQSKQEFHGFF